MSETTIQPSQIAALTTPLNLTLLAILVIVGYVRLSPKAPLSLPKRRPPIVFKTFSPPDLQPFNGEDGKPIYMGVRGNIFDVSEGRRFYGPGGPYENFAGRDASRGLACGSFDEEMLTKDLQGPLDDLKDLGSEEMESLRGWEEQFNSKYLIIGKLVSVGDKAEMK